MKNFRAECQGDKRDRQAAGHGQPGRCSNPGPPGTCLLSRLRDRLPYCLEQSATHDRIREQCFQRLFVGQGIEQVLVLQGRCIQTLLFVGRQRISREAAQQLSQLVFRHTVCA